MNTVFAMSALTGASLLSIAATDTLASSFSDRDKPFDQYHWVTTHNAYEKINQNLKEMPQQLSDGVRGFMLDLHTDDTQHGLNRIKVCHGSLACYGPWGKQLKNEFIPFLKENPNEVITMFLESHVTRDDLRQVFEALPELAEYSFHPASFNGDQWPTLAQMASSNNRLILLTDRWELEGSYVVGEKAVRVLYDQNWLVQNRWDTLGAVATNLLVFHDFSCPTRWREVPLSTRAVARETGKRWNRLFLMNQFHSATSTAMDSAAYDNNLTYLMRRTKRCGVTPNFIGINNYRNGDTLSYTRALSQGGIYLWEGPRADKTQDTVCVIPAETKTLSLPAEGCENDEAQSLSLSGIAKDTRITVFDSPRASLADDYAVIEVKRDIGIREDVIVHEFERTLETDDYRVDYFKYNGLNGKVSRVEIAVP
ncbi:hypothetical protein SAMN05216593_11530 [Pseudomonas asturiensis]|uniref:1-phosphatidylinositol phosphodiesterase n=1 Tax=Pseudomonas asturiensis TaxID=1190415 RepID=A0A1M7PY44_9PSED|nr:hypothetical protein [Pseudomonas asturiensis]SHN22577.1 hypothetical protein SAMN05216593_11530 [Pseudomonas asturiensis]